MLWQVLHELIPYVSEGCECILLPVGSSGGFVIKTQMGHEELKTSPAHACPDLRETIYWIPQYFSVGKTLFHATQPKKQATESFTFNYVHWLPFFVQDPETLDVCKLYNVTDHFVSYKQSESITGTVSILTTNCLVSGGPEHISSKGSCLVGVWMLAPLCPILGSLAFVWNTEVTSSLYFEKNGSWRTRIIRRGIISSLPLWTLWVLCDPRRR